MREDKHAAEIQNGVQERKDSTKIALVSCSNGMTESFRPSFLRLLSILEEAGLEPVYGNHLFAGEENPAGQSGRKRAEELMRYYCDPSVDAVLIFQEAIWQMRFCRGWTSRRSGRRDRESCCLDTAI